MWGSRQQGREQRVSKREQERTIERTIERARGGGRKTQNCAAPRVLSIPGRRLERTHCVSTTHGFATTAAVLPSLGLFTFSKLSAREHSTHVRTSKYPACAASALRRSERAFSGCWRPTVLVVGMLFGMLLNPKAIATSSITSAACSTSGRVGGTCTFTAAPPWLATAVSCIRLSSCAARSASSDSPGGGGNTLRAGD